MKSDAYIIEDLTIARDKIVGQRIYDENKHKTVRQFGPLDYSAKNIPTARVKPATQRQVQRRISAENTDRMIAWIVKHGPGTSEQVAAGTGIPKRVVATALGAAKMRRRMRNDCGVWQVSKGST